MNRPAHLPNFSNPPLDEIVLGVQFSPITSYSSIEANGIWALFKEKFPKVEEHPILEPNFETFGGATPAPGIQLKVGVPPVGSRLWFISADENSLLQFQSDRFLLNWRNRPHPQDYPRFETIADLFETNLNTLDAHLAKTFECRLDVNQAEISYINVIPVEKFSEAGKWFKYWDGDKIEFEALNANFNEIVLDEVGQPIARLIYEFQSVLTLDGKNRAFRFSLSFRGKPKSNDVAAVVEFIALGRRNIVNRFSEMTTNFAHETWGRTA